MSAFEAALARALHEAGIGCFEIVGIGPHPVAKHAADANAIVRSLAADPAWAEQAICRSEVAGSGHATGDMPCEWHTVAGNIRVERFLAALTTGPEP